MAFAQISKGHDWSDDISSFGGPGKDTRAPVAGVASAGDRGTAPNPPSTSGGPRGFENAPALSDKRQGVVTAKDFEVVAWTTNINNAGTKCPVYIMFRGDKGDSGPHLLTLPRDRRKGANDISTFMSRGVGVKFAPVGVSTIGHLQSIRIGVGMDLTGPDANDAWNCLRVLVTCNNLELGKFDCLQWIGARDEPRDAQKDLVDVRDSTASALRASTASALTTTAAAAAAGDKFKEEQVLYKDHDGYENDVQYPSQPPVRLTWFWRELHPVKWFKPETARERDTQARAAPKELSSIPDPEEDLVIGVSEKARNNHTERMSVLVRPVWRKPVPPPMNKVWLPSTTHVSAEQEALNEMKEREALSEWLRGGNEGGVIALAKRLNKSRSYVEQKLRHFETTNKGHRYYVPPSPASTIRTRPPTARAENMVNPIGGLMPEGGGFAQRGFGTATPQLGMSRAGSLRMGTPTFGSPAIMNH